MDFHFANFETEEDIFSFLENLRWKGKPRCTKCASLRVFKNETCRVKHTWHCSDCAHNFRVTVGTIFDKSNLSLILWFEAIRVIAETPAISSIKLGKYLDITQKSAWFMGHRIRELMITGDEILNGVVESILAPTLHNKHVDTVVKKTGAKVSRAKSGKVKVERVNPNARFRQAPTGSKVAAWVATAQETIVEAHYQVSDKHQARYLTQQATKRNRRKVGQKIVEQFMTDPLRYKELIK